MAKMPVVVIPHYRPAQEGRKHIKVGHIINSRMGFVIFLCRMIGVSAGFVVPVVGGLYASAMGNAKQANYFLRALIIWVVMDTIFSPILGAFCGIVSGFLWPLIFSILSIALVVPRARAIEYGDKYIVSVIKSGKLNCVTTKCMDILQPLRSKVEKFIEPSASKSE